MLDLSILGLFVAVSVWAGLRSRKAASRGLDDFFLAGRSLRGWQAGTSMAATQFAADTPLIVMGLIATAGIFALWQLWIYGLAFLLLAFVFSRCWQRAGVLTDAELTELRYGGRGALALRIFKAIYYGTVINCVVLAMVLKATIAITEVFLPWHEWLPAIIHWPLVEIVRNLELTVASGLTDQDPAVASADNLISVVAILGFVALYSMTGGLRSVVFTDVLQFGLAMLGTLIYAYAAVVAAGGLDSLSGSLIDLYGGERAATMMSFAPRSADLLGPLLVIVSLQWVFQVSSDGTGYLAQRSMSCRTSREATIAGVTFAWLQILLRSLPWLVLGIALLVIHPFNAAEAADAQFKAHREFVFITGIDDLLPAGARGLLLVGLLGALASTLDTHLNWGAGYWSNDLYKRAICQVGLEREPRPKELVLVARLSNVALLLIAMSIVPALDSIQQAWKLSLLFGAGVGSVLVLRWVWERINLWSEVAAIGVSIVLAPLLLIWTGGRDELEWLRLGAMAVISTIAAIGITWVTPRTQHDALRRFYERIDPPGFWRRTASEAGRLPSESARRLRRALMTTGVTALSLYACLYGSARLLLPHPRVSWHIPAAVLLVGVLLIPFWARRAFRDRGQMTTGPVGAGPVEPSS